MVIPPRNLAIKPLLVQQFHGHEGQRPSSFEALTIRVSVARFHNGRQVKVVQNAVFVVLLIHEIMEADIAMRDPDTPEQCVACNVSSIPISSRRGKNGLTAKGMPKGRPKILWFKGVDGSELLREHPELNTKPFRGI